MVSILVRNAVPDRLFGELWKAFRVGKSVESVSPATYALPDASAAMALPKSPLVPPRNVEYISEVLPLPLTVGSSFVTNAIPLVLPEIVRAFFVGKSVANVVPVT